MIASFIPEIAMARVLRIVMYSSTSPHMIFLLARLAAGNEDLVNGWLSPISVLKKLVSHIFILL